MGEAGSTNVAFFEDRLRQMAAGRPARDLFHARLFPGQRPETASTCSLAYDVGDWHELVFVTDGRARVSTPSQVFDLVPGQLLLIDRAVEHDEAPADPACGYKAFWCGIGDIVVHLTQTSYSPPSRYRAGPGVELTGRTDVESIAAAISSEMSRQESGWLQAIAGLLNYLTCILIRRLRRGNGAHLQDIESPAISTDPRAWHVIRAALQFCDANYRGKMRLTEMAAVLGYSPSHLSRLFSRHVGHSLSDHIRQLRTNTAKHLLENSDLSITQIALSVGYTDPSNFSHAFTRDTGAAPTVYRRHLRGL